jgi:hypothetical protein
MKNRVLILAYCNHIMDIDRGPSARCAIGYRGQNKISNYDFIKNRFF